MIFVIIFTQMSKVTLKKENSSSDPRIFPTTHEEPHIAPATSPSHKLTLKKESSISDPRIFPATQEAAHKAPATSPPSPSQQSESKSMNDSTNLGYPLHILRLISQVDPNNHIRCIGQLSSTYHSTAAQPVKLPKAESANSTFILQQRPTTGLPWLNCAFSTLGTASWDNNSSVLDETKLAQFFEKYDEDRTGVISCTKLQAALHLESDGHFTDTDFSKLLDMSSRDHDHGIDLAEFRRLLLRINSKSRPFGETRECVEVVDLATTNQHAHSTVGERVDESNARLLDR